MSLKVKKQSLCLVVGWACLQTLVTLAATPAASVVADTDELIDTRINFLIRSIADAGVDARLYIRTWSAASGATVDTLTPCGTVVLIR